MGVAFSRTGYFVNSMLHASQSRFPARLPTILLGTVTGLATSRALEWSFLWVRMCGARRARIWRSSGAGCVLLLLARSAGRTCTGAARRCRGFLHADGYAGFNSLFTEDPKSGQPRLTEVACWAHARRNIYEVYESNGSSPAKEALERIAELFEIEARINGRAPRERLAVRQQKRRCRCCVSWKAI
jgi:hypothetical protein